MDKDEIEATIESALEIAKDIRRELMSISANIVRLEEAVSEAAKFPTERSSC